MSVEVCVPAEIYRSDGQPLAEGYKAFHKTPTTVQEYDQTWADRICYLQDLLHNGEATGA